MKKKKKEKDPEDKFPDFSKMKWVRGPEIPKEALNPKNVKVRITTYISEDIYRWLKREGEEKGIPYQILLNLKLRHLYEESRPDSIQARLRKLEERMGQMESVS